MIMDWKQMPEGKEKYNAYLASREWAVIKVAIRERSGGVCEWCKHDPAAEVHHQTYIRKYREPLTDLMHLCRPCHQFKSGLSKEDPREYWIEKPPAKPYLFVIDRQGEKSVECPGCRGDWNNVHTCNPTTQNRYHNTITLPFWCECGCEWHWQIRYRNGETTIESVTTRKSGDHENWNRNERA